MIKDIIIHVSAGPHWRFVLVVGTVAFAGGVLGNFLREIAVRIIEAVRTWWGS